MKNKKIILSVVFILSFILLCILIQFIFYNTFKNEYIFPRNSTVVINNIEINSSSKNSKMVFDMYLGEYKNRNFSIVLGDEKNNLDLKDTYKHSLTIKDLNSKLENISFATYLFKRVYKFEFEDELVIDKDKLHEKLYNLIKKTNYKHIKSEDAYLDKNFNIIEEINGTEIDTEKSIIDVLNYIKENKTEINLQDEKYYKKAKMTKEDILSKHKRLIDISKWKATYKDSDYTISMIDYMEYVNEDENGNCTIDYSFMKDAVLELSKTIDKVGEAKLFNSTLDGQIKLSGGTYGQVMDNDKEIEFLIDKINKNEIVENRIPIWKVEPKDEKYEETYIEVDLSAQHVWYYKNNELVLDGDCVSGTDKTKRSTPTGWYFITEKIDGKYLRGPGYKTWVDKWMRFTSSGHGFHDAKWRNNSEFGGNTYKYDGSHGCVNLNKKFAYELFDNIEAGVLVVIHN